MTITTGTWALRRRCIARARARTVSLPRGRTGGSISLDGASKKPVFKAPGTTIQTITLDGRLPETQTLVCPGLGGGAEYNGAAYDPGTGALYTGEVDWCSYYQKPKPKPAASDECSGRSASSIGTQLRLRRRSLG